MCGICGFVGPADPRALTAMRDALAHRGPDDFGSFVGQQVSLGHRRLAIVDPDHGRQPAYSDDRSVVLVYNGEVYNHPQLRHELEEWGYPYSGNSDTQSVLAAYARYGVKAAEHLDGMFAFVLYDRRRRILYGARDRLGEKPLYYTRRPFGSVPFAFASELKALRQHPELAKNWRTRRSAILAYLLHDYLPGPESIVDGIERLPPGWAFTYGLDGAEQEGFSSWRYWELPLVATPRPAATIEQAQGEVLRLLERAVDRQLMADVPLGVFLSGGIDSATLVALLRRRHPDRRLTTFSIAFDEPSFDESRHAESVARQFQTEHHVRRFTVDGLLEELPGLVEQLDEPYADPSILPVSALSRFAREQVKVVLGGDGGDELFAGYDPIRAVRTAIVYDRLVPTPLHARLQGCAQRLSGSEENMSWGFRLSRFLRGAKVPPRFRCATWMGPFAPAQLDKICPAILSTTDINGGYTVAAGWYDRAERAGADSLRQALLFFAGVYLPDDILVKVDRAGMRHGLEIRAPYLDRELVEYVFALPDGWKYRRGVTKWLLKRAVTATSEGPPLLPAAIAYRAKKGFGIPVARWLRGPLAGPAREMILDALPSRLECFARDAIEELWQRHQRRQGNFYKELWALFLLAHWAERHAPSI